MRRQVVAVVAAAATLVGATACGGSSSTGSSSGSSKKKRIELTLDEMAISPKRVVVTVGDVVTFHVRNVGKVRHEAVFGDQRTQDQAVAMMAAMGSGSAASTSLPPQGGRSRPALGHPGMSLPNVISLEPGKSGDLTFTFSRTADLLIQCHEAGHLEAGMAAELVVEAK